MYSILQAMWAVPLYLPAWTGKPYTEIPFFFKHYIITIILQITVFKDNKMHFLNLHIIILANSCQNEKYIF